MKKVTDFLKPNILIIFGALLLLYFMNWLQYDEGWLAIGIIAVIFSAYYLAIGILEIIIGNKLSPSVKKIFEVISGSLFPLLMFIYFLIVTINMANNMGPTAWIIEILSMVACLALIAVYIISKFANKEILNRFAYLFAAIFALALLLNVLFDEGGGARALGNINVILTVIYIAFMFFLFNCLGNKEEAQPEKAPVEQKEEPKEEAPAEEEPTEENKEEEPKEE